MVASLPFADAAWVKSQAIARFSQPGYRTAQPWERDWHAWMQRLFPDLAAFAPHHEWFWERIWHVEPGVKPSALVALWPRGGAKSSSAEMAAVALGARRKRRYGLYVSGTQEQAEEHLDAIAALLESPQITRDYPDMADRDVNKYGSSRGWRRNRLTTRAGFTMDAVGLMTGTRGIKFESQRPDFIVVDDVDNLHDTLETTQKKVDTLTKTLLPAGSTDLAVVAIQNLITIDGVFARLAPGSHKPADFLLDREVSGPIPAIEDLEYEQRDGRFHITGGVPTWDGQTVATAQAQMNEWGEESFLAEAQHAPQARGAKSFKRELWDGQNRYDVHDTRLLSQAVARYMSWDTAESETEGSAWTAAVTGDIVPFRGGYALLVRDVWRDRVETPALLDAIEAQARRWGMDVTRRNMRYGVVVEYASSGKAVVQAAKATNKSLRLQAPAWLSRLIHRFPPMGSKEDRAKQAAVPARNGRVWLPAPDPAVPWLFDFEAEWFAFPQSRYKDQVDATVNLILYLRNYLKEPGQRLPNQREDIAA